MRPRQRFDTSTVRTAVSDFTQHEGLVANTLLGLHYEDNASEHWESSNAHALVFVVADKYRLTSLKTAALHRMKLRITRSPFPDQNFWDTLGTIWKGTGSKDKSARAFLVEVCISNISKLLTRPEFVQLMRDTELGADIVMASMAADSDLKRNLASCRCGRLLEAHGQMYCADCKVRGTGFGNAAWYVLKKL